MVETYLMFMGSSKILTLKYFFQILTSFERRVEYNQGKTEGIYRIYLDILCMDFNPFEAFYKEQIGHSRNTGGCVVNTGRGI